jgi:hypothetical protein
MPLKIWSGTAWQQASAIKVWNGSAWTSATAGKVWNGSAWVSFFGDLVALPGNPYSISGVAPAGSTASATLRFSSAGTVASIRTNSGGTTTTVEYGTWLLSGAASDYRLVLTSGNVGLLNVYAGAASALSTPYSFSVDISLSAGSGGPNDITRSQTYGFDIRTSGGSTLISGSVILTADYTGTGA